MSTPIYDCTRVTSLLLTGGQNTIIFWNLFSNFLQYLSHFCLSDVRATQLGRPSLHIYSLGKWWRHLTMLWYWHEVTGSKQTHYSMNQIIVLIFFVCFTNGKDIAVQSQKWLTFVAVLWLHRTKIHDRVFILVLVSLVSSDFKN